jgi:hypothetical protein
MNVHIRELLLPTSESNKVNNRYLIVVIVKPVYQTSSLLLKIALIAFSTTRLSIKTLMTTARGRSWRLAPTNRMAGAHCGSDVQQKNVAQGDTEIVRKTREMSSRPC